MSYYYANSTDSFEMRSGSVTLYNEKGFKIIERKTYRYHEDGELAYYHREKDIGMQKGCDITFAYPLNNSKNEYSVIEKGRKNGYFTRLTGDNKYTYHKGLIVDKTYNHVYNANGDLTQYSIQINSDSDQDLFQSNSHLAIDYEYNANKDWIKAIIYQNKKPEFVVVRDIEYY
ncbi:hypothetical protein [Marinilabilia salmonicolor]|uniref:hypothetical protein n=1 Tax=Marinilabilia salmonicolor TaxID=989 RepID=UPI000D04E18A|nr:hypothetical protein [Marinilabilia salmonicolor]